MAEAFPLSGCREPGPETPSRDADEFEVARKQRLTRRRLDPVPNPVPNLGIRGEWRGKEVEECQQLTDSHHPPGGFESLPFHHKLFFEFR